MSRTGPFWEEKPLSRSRAAQQAVHAPLPTTAPVQRGPIQACLPGLARTHDSMCRDISCRGQRLALGRINACFCLLSYFIYIFKTAYQGKKIALQKKKKKFLASGRHRGGRLGWHWGPRPAMQSGLKPAWAPAQASCRSGEWGSRGDDILPEATTLAPLDFFIVFLRFPQGYSDPAGCTALSIPPGQQRVRKVSYYLCLSSA